MFFLHHTYGTPPTVVVAAGVSPSAHPSLPSSNIYMFLPDRVFYQGEPRPTNRLRGGVRVMSARPLSTAPSINTVALHYALDSSAVSLAV